MSKPDTQDTTPIDTPAILPDPAPRRAQRPYTTPNAIAVGRATEVMQGGTGTELDLLGWYPVR